MTVRLNQKESYNGELPRLVPVENTQMFASYA